jgi:hypothetical protein
MNILIVKSIFCPNKKYYDITISSIIKLHQFLLINDLLDKITLMFVGWVHIFEKEFITFVNIFPFNVNIILKLWENNYGKTILFNKLITFLNKNNFDDHIIFYMDHDIFLDFDNDIKILFNLFDMIKSDITIDQKKIGLVATNHKNDSRHQLDIYENNFNLNSVSLIWPNYFMSIGVGCFLICAKIFKTLDQVEPFSVYGLCDVHILEQLNNKNYHNCIIENFYAIHPYSDDNDYIKWKYEQILKSFNQIKNIENDEVNKKLLYDQSMIDSYNFWNK